MTRLAWIAAIAIGVTFAFGALVSAIEALVSSPGANPASKVPETDREAVLRGRGKLMLKDRRSAAMKVVEGLYAAEDAIDAALACAAELNAILVKARAEAKVSAMVGQDAFETAASAFAALARARCEMVETHKRLSDTKIQLGLRTVAIGDLVPKTAQVGDGGRHLQAVG